MKNISIEQINAILNTVYATNISAQAFDAIKKLFSELKDVIEVTQADVIPSEVTDH